MAEKHQFLSDEWFAAVAAIVAEHGGGGAAHGPDTKVNLNVTDTPFDADRQFHMGGMAVFQGVFHQVVQGAPQGGRAAGQQHTFAAAEGCGTSHIRHIAAQALDQGRHIDDFQDLGGGIVPGERQNGRDHRLHLVEILEHLGLLLVIIDEFGA